MSKPPDWELLDKLMKKHYPRKYAQRQRGEQTRLDLPELDPPQKGGKRRAAGSRTPSPQRQGDHLRR